jgi:hypothetical protein
MWVFGIFVTVVFGALYSNKTQCKLPCMTNGQKLSSGAMIVTTYTTNAIHQTVYRSPAATHIIALVPRDGIFFVMIENH